MAKFKAKGLMGDDKGGPSLSHDKGLVGYICHHAGKGQFSRIGELCLAKPEILEELDYRAEMLNTDMKTLNDALKEIQEIARREGYGAITEILEERMYEHGHDYEGLKE